MVQKVKRAKTAHEALSALMRLCARAERSSGDAIRLMHGWGLAEEEAQQVLARLVRERFIDDGRYAEAFVRDKMRLSGWGAYKIASALRAKGVAKGVIDEAMKQATPTDMRDRLISLLTRRMKTMKYKSKADARQKLLRYALSAGYDFSTARDCVESINLGTADDEETFFSDD